MRTHLRGVVKPLIPSAVRSAIKLVAKTQVAYDTAGSEVTQNTTDDVWIPSYPEVYGSAALYFPLFQNANANRVKKKKGTTSAVDWWLRTGWASNYYGPTCFYFIKSTGNDDSARTHAKKGIALGFCT